jgi:hypothetical protein
MNLAPTVCVFSEEPISNSFDGGIRFGCGCFEIDGVHNRSENCEALVEGRELRRRFGTPYVPFVRNARRRGFQQ